MAELDRLLEESTNRRLNELYLALVEIREVACGETQLDSCHDDTDALAWIFRRAERALVIERGILGGETGKDSQ